MDINIRYYTPLLFNIPVAFTKFTNSKWIYTLHTVHVHRLIYRDDINLWNDMQVMYIVLCISIPIICERESGQDCAVQVSRDSFVIKLCRDNVI